LLQFTSGIINKAVMQLKNSYFWECWG